MKDKDLGHKQFLYSLFIGLSVFDICAGLFFAYKLCLQIIAQKSPSTFSNEAAKSNTFYIALYGICIVICAVLYPILTAKRQSFRDEVEYDENGMSRKNKFSQLSKKERDAIEQQKTIDRERILPSTVLKAATHKGSETPEIELDKMIGLANVKAEVEKMIARMEFEAGKCKNKHTETHVFTSMNMLFTGNPGTGKTSIARIMAAFLYKYGYIKKNQSIEVDGNFFNGLSKGESSAKTSALIQAARGGVLFIDEAYALLTGGQEVIATIVKAMEDYRDDTVFIFAGYEREMSEFIESNSGLKSRFKYILHFNDYNDAELSEIFEMMAHEAGFCVTPDIKDKAIDLLSKKRHEAFFGNARDVRNLVDKAIDNHALNIKQRDSIDPSMRYYLLGIDL